MGIKSNIEYFDIRNNETKMKNFVFKRQPKAYQGSKTFKSSSAKSSYSDELEKSIRQFNNIDGLPTEDLYGVVYYFHKKKTGTDADNISKPIWDCLKGILFDDDKRIKLRIAGIIDISKDDFDLTIFDFSNVREEIITELMEAFETIEHFAYIECGLLNNAMYKFNL